MFFFAISLPAPADVRGASPGSFVTEISGDSDKDFVWFSCLEKIPVDSYDTIFLKNVINACNAMHVQTCTLCKIMRESLLNVFLAKFKDSEEKLLTSGLQCARNFGQHFV